MFIGVYTQQHASPVGATCFFPQSARTWRFSGASDVSVRLVYKHDAPTALQAKTWLYDDDATSAGHQASSGATLNTHRLWDARGWTARAGDFLPNEMLPCASQSEASTGRPIPV
jgi:hypothetical protein